MEKQKKLAILNFNRAESRGIPALVELGLKAGYAPENIDVINAWDALKIPTDTHEHDCYIFTGGDGDPAEDGEWLPEVKNLAYKIFNHNADNPEDKIRASFICLSEQNLARLLRIAATRKRSAGNLFGIHSHEIQTKHKIPEKIRAILPQQAFESRDYQVDPTDEFLENGAVYTAPSGATIKFIPLMVRREGPNDVALTAFCSDDGEEFPSIMAWQYHPEAMPEVVAAMLNMPDFQDRIRNQHGANAVEMMQRQIPALKSGNEMVLIMMNNRNAKYVAA